MRNICQIVMLLLALSACSGKSGRERMLRVVEEWQGKEIVLPEVMMDFLTGDTVDLSDADFTILTYVDSAGCTGCKMRLTLWKEYLSSLDSVCTDADVRFAMIVHTDDLYGLRKTLQQYSFENHVSVDSLCVMESLNEIPAETEFQTFLLDRHRHVMAIGSPVQSAEIGKLYKSIISGKITLSPALDAMVTVDPGSVRLGELAGMETALRKVRFSNAGNDTVRISKVISSCECTELELPSWHIPPSSEIEGSLHFKGDSITGEFERYIHVYYEGMEYPTVIYIAGNIK